VIAGADRTERRRPVRLADAERRRPSLSQLPNFVTLLALACGLSAARLAVEPQPRLGAVLLLMAAAALLDALDGRLARLLDAQSEMGAQLDSLCDAVSFGVAPAFITYFLAAHDPSSRFDTVAWLAAVLYAGAIVLRLARFNVLLEDPHHLAIDKEFFVGVPAPAAAWLALLPVVARAAFGQGWWSHPLTDSVWLIAVACLAFSRIPTFTFKTVRLTPRQVPFALFAGLILIAGLFSFPYATIMAVLAVYLAHIPFAVRSRRWLLRHPQAWQAPNPERRRMRRERRRERRQLQRRRRERGPRRRPRLRRRSRTAGAADPDDRA
jgi:CDP-diacylglycerol--serine O-phosphatidyltransferase